VFAEASDEVGGDGGFGCGNGSGWHLGMLMDGGKEINAGGSAGTPDGSVNTGGGGYGSINNFTNGLGGSGVVIIAIPR